MIDAIEPLTQRAAANLRLAQNLDLSILHSHSGFGHFQKMIGHYLCTPVAFSSKPIGFYNFVWVKREEDKDIKYS
ncbi:Uncharacterised protein [uncultured archaeon]|nr:Uncharacterised protein [uncultured archaeon]